MSGKTLGLSSLLLLVVVVVVLGWKVLIGYSRFAQPVQRQNSEKNLPSLSPIKFNIHSTKAKTSQDI